LKKIEKIIIKLNADLDVIEKETDGVLEKAEESIKIAQKALKQIKLILLTKKVVFQKQEIYFFKKFKPHIFSKLIYFTKLFSIESRRPRGSNKSQIKYFNQHIDRLQNYFNENLEFYHYYRRDSIFLDKEYFIRGKVNIRLFPD